VKSNLRNTNKGELSRGIKRDFQTLLEDRKAGSALCMDAYQFDDDTLVQLLSQRQTLSEQ